MYYFSNLFLYRALHVSYRFTVNRQESSTVYTVTRICPTGILKMGKVTSVYTVLDS